MLKLGDEREARRRARVLGRKAPDKPSGLCVYAPKGFTAQFPPYPLDGELYSGRGQFEQISATVRSVSSDWRGIRLHVFDVPKAQGNLYQRLAVATQWLKTHPNAPITIIPQIKVRDRRHAMDF